MVIGQGRGQIQWMSGRFTKTEESQSQHGKSSWSRVDRQRRIQGYRLEHLWIIDFKDTKKQPILLEKLMLYFIHIGVSSFLHGIACESWVKLCCASHNDSMGQRDAPAPETSGRGQWFYLQFHGAGTRLPVLCFPWEAQQCMLLPETENCTIQFSWNMYNLFNEEIESIRFVRSFVPATQL